MKRVMLVLRGIGGKVRRYRDRWFGGDEQGRAGVREALAMFDYDASDDPC
jgi:hypothetical protein